jgi:demethylmenaquinone methyltransferase/2-methoxy-6-polyprenyl-1,4-benzoquinol methylase
MKGPEATKIRSMFGSISDRYDRANTVLSGGIHHLWRRRLVALSGARPGQRVLDTATGTGDLALAFAQAVGPTGEVLGTDFCEPMLRHAPAKAARAGLANVRFEVADVTQLPYADASFDLASISFGIRNVEDPSQALSELGRVVKPGGRVLILEFGQPENALFRKVYESYSKHVLPKLGGLVTGQPEAYTYLEGSSAQFPCREDFLELMKDTGRFDPVDFESVSLGIAYIYRGAVRAL